jgi:pimeloyl-ACP methyl ester carboxylesterase
MTRRLLRSAAALGVLVGSWAAAPVQASASDLATPCQDVTMPVSIADGQPATYEIWGQLCIPQEGPAATVQVLLHGLDYSHVYWDFPFRPDQYSYVRWATGAGYATFNLDRIGVGRSSHPPSGQVSLTSNAFTIHQVVAALRSGRQGGHSFQKVVLVGHSYGSEIAKLEASLFSDVDALILTGNAHRISPSAITILSGLGQSVQEVPRLAAEVPPGDSGYTTLQDAARPEIMYNLPDADPLVVAQDIATKETNTLEELFTIGDADLPAVTAHLRIPVLIADGGKDRLACAPDATDCSSPATLAAAEQPFYPETRVDAAVIPNAGHAINLHLNAPLAYISLIAWTDWNVGTGRVSG